MQGLKPCSFCNESTHTERKCPELVAPIREDRIQKPSGGRPHGGGDDEEDSMNIEPLRINRIYGFSESKYGRSLQGVPPSY